MLKVVIVAAVILWLQGFFGHFDFPGPRHISSLIDLLSIAIVLLIIVGFLS